MSQDLGPDDVSITAGGQKISSWQVVEITRSLETCPNVFRLSYTERDGIGATVSVEPGSPCVIAIGDDTVITGYADQVEAAIGADGHSLAIAGRGKCEDLVDCSSEWPSAAIANTDVLDVAQKLAAPYGIKVALGPNTKLGAPQPIFNVDLLETPFSIIEEMARWSQVLPYEDASGNLLLSAVGTVRHASGFIEGANVQEATVRAAMDERFSEYRGWGTSTQGFSDLGDGLNLFATETDPSVKRHRLRSLSMEGNYPSLDLLQRRVAWERSRRAGRGVQVRLVADSWRDSAGQLWTPNQLAPVSLPSLHLNNVSWVIGEVTFRLDAEQGTRAELTLMPPEAYSPEPVQLQPVLADVTPVPGGSY